MLRYDLQASNGIEVAKIEILCLKLHRVGVNNRCTFYIFIVRPSVKGAKFVDKNYIEAKLDVFCGDRFAIVKLGAFANREREGLAIFRYRGFFRQFRAPFVGVFVARHQGVQHIALHP